MKKGNGPAAEKKRRGKWGSKYRFNVVKKIMGLYRNSIPPSPPLSLSLKYSQFRPLRGIKIIELYFYN